MVDLVRRWHKRAAPDSAGSSWQGYVSSFDWNFLNSRGFVTTRDG